MRRRSRASELNKAAVAAALFLAACAPAVEVPVEAPRTAPRSLEGAVHYRVVQEETLVYARVFRAGSLAALGHNHVVVFDDVGGDIFVADEIGDSLFDLSVSLAEVTVDPPELRSRQGRDFQSDISQDARERTRRNMLGEKMLDAERHPYVTLSSSAVEGPLPRLGVTLDLTIGEVTRQVTVPVEIEHEGDRLAASGRFDLLQSDFGIEPFSALGGALKVEDRVEVVFSITARKVPSLDAPALNGAQRHSSVFTWPIRLAVAVPGTAFFKPSR